MKREVVERHPGRERVRGEGMTQVVDATAGNSGSFERGKRLLTLAAEAWDRAQQARAALDEHGLTYLDRFAARRTRSRSPSSATPASASPACSAT
jgi:hypothetical protein